MKKRRRPNIQLTGDMVRRIRGALELNQEELSALTLVSRATISLFESRGEEHLPSSMAGRTLAAVLLDHPRVEVDDMGVIRVVVS
jgi:DNA-binding transcriptional regulator YiaG